MKLIDGYLEVLDKYKTVNKWETKEDTVKSIKKLYQEFPYLTAYKIKSNLSASLSSFNNIETRLTLVSLKHFIWIQDYEFYVNRYLTNQMTMTDLKKVLYTEITKKERTLNLNRKDRILEGMRNIPKEINKAKSYTYNL